MSSIALNHACRTLLDRFPEPVLAVDDERMHLDANGSACALLSLDKAQAIGRQIDEIVTSDTQPLLAAAWSEGLASGSANCQLQMQLKQGSTLDVDFKIVANMAPGVHICFLRDVTDHRRRRYQHLETQHVAELALAAGRMGSWVWSVRSASLKHNERLPVLFGLDARNAGYEQFLARIHPQDVECVRDTIGQALAGKSNYEVEFRVGGPEGTVRWLAGRGEVLTDGADNIAAIAGVMWDVTDAKEAEAALRYSEHRCRTIIEQSPFSIQLFSPDGQVLMINEAWRELWGATWNAVKDYNILRDEQLGEVMPLIQRAFLGERCHLPVVRYSPPNGMRAGQELWIRGFLYPVNDSRARVMQVVLVHQDVTAEHRIDQERTARDRELARSNSELQRFTYVASHDLKEPLRNVCTFSQMLQQRVRDRLDEDELEIIDLISSGAKRMYELIDGLLDYSRASLHRDLVFTEASAEELFAQALQNLRVSIDQTGTVIEHETLPAIRCSPMEIVQLIQNLLGNAIKYRGDKPGHIIVRASETPEEWIFEVTDNGIGIDPRYHDQIFGVFKRLHRDEYAGTGIGLAICKAVVEKHGGRIWVESEEGRGATFRFTLPK